MFRSLLTPSRMRAALVLCSVIYLAAALGPAIGAQARRGVDMDATNTGNGGAGTITGHIYYPGGRPFDQRVSVRLQSLNGEQITFSNENGSFTFARLSPGTYYIQVDAGKEYEPVRETVEILGQRRAPIGSGIVVPVYINLKEKLAVVERAGTVDATLAGVPEPALKLYNEARTLARSGQREKSIELLDKAIDKYPEFMQAHHEKGFQYLQLNQPQKAIAPLEAALKLAPEAFMPRLNYGVALLQSGRLISSILELRRASQNHDSSSYVHLYLGVAYLNVDLDADAEHELGRAIQLGGEETIVAHRYLGGLYARRGDKARAAAELEVYLRSSPEPADSQRIRKIIADLRRPM